MRFWSRLRWIGTLAFAVVLLITWLGTEPAPPPDAPPLRLAPVFQR